jgi:hypothetical protein
VTPPGLDGTINFAISIEGCIPPPVVREEFNRNMKSRRQPHLPPWATSDGRNSDE